MPKTNKHSIPEAHQEMICDGYPHLLSRSEHDNTRHAEVAALMEKLSLIMSLKPGWDGYHAHPISRSVYNNVMAALSQCTDEDVKGWRALPEINGTISLQNDQQRAGIQIGNTAFSYFVIQDSTVSGDDHITFSVPQFMHILRTINK